MAPSGQETSGRLRPVLNGRETRGPATPGTTSLREIGRAISGRLHQVRSGKETLGTSPQGTHGKETPGSPQANRNGVRMVGMILTRARTGVRTDGMTLTRARTGVRTVVPTGAATHGISLAPGTATVGTMSE